MISAASVQAVGSTSGLTSWIQSNVVGLVILVVGVAVVIKAFARNAKDAVVMVGVVLIGLAVVGLSVGGKGVAVGQWISTLVLG